MAYVAPSAPQSIGGVLDDWLRLFRESFSRCWILALVATVASAYDQIVLIPHLPSANLPPLEYFTQLATAYRGPQVFLTDLVFWLILLVVYGAVVIQQLSVARGRVPRSPGAALGASLSRFLQMLLGVLVLLVCVAVLGAIIGISGAMLIHLRAAPGMAALAGLVALAVIAAVIYASVRVQFWLVALFDQDLGGPRAIARSWQLTRGHWWRITGILFVAGVVIWVLSIVFGLVAGLLAGGLAVGGGSTMLLHHLRLLALISSLSRLITLPLLTAVWIAVYRDLTLRSEGADLAARTEALGGH